MFYNAEDFSYNIEELINDYLMYGRKKEYDKISSVNAQNDNNGNMPNRNGNNMIPDMPNRNGNNMIPDMPNRNGNNMMPDMPNRNGNNMMPDMPNRNGNNMMPDMPNRPAQPIMPEQPDTEYRNIVEDEIELMRLLYTEINRRLYPFIEEILDEYDYADSPIYSDEGVDRETIAQLIDRAIDNAAQVMDEVEEITLEPQTMVFQAQAGWDRNMLLRSIAEAIILNEIFHVRRPRYRRTRNRYNYNNGRFNGGRRIY